MRGEANVTRRSFGRRRPVGRTAFTPEISDQVEAKDGGQVTGPDELWVADITHIPTWAGFLYLSVLMDAWGRKIVGWSMATHLRTELVMDAFDMALWQLRPEDVIHHSDRGCQYTLIVFGLRCKNAGLRPSMGSVADCYDDPMSALSSA